MTNIWQKSIKEVKVKKQYIPESLPKLTPRQGPWPIDVPVPQGVKLVAIRIMRTMSVSANPNLGQE
jgi:hypothetical protein